MSRYSGASNSWLTPYWLLRSVGSGSCAYQLRSSAASDYASFVSSNRLIAAQEPLSAPHSDAKPATPPAP